MKLFALSFVYIDVKSQEGRCVQTDNELMARLKLGDVSALETLIDRHRAAAESFAMQMLHDPGLAEEMVMEAFARVYLARQQYRADYSFRTWLMALVRNLCIDQLRRMRRTPVPTDQLPELPAPSPESELLALEKRVRLWNELSSLSETDRALLTGFALDQLSYHELARKHGLTSSQVRIRLHRLRKRLREKERDDS